MLDQKLNFLLFFVRILIASDCFWRGVLKKAATNVFFLDERSCWFFQRLGADDVTSLGRVVPHDVTRVCQLCARTLWTGDVLHRSETSEPVQTYYRHTRQKWVKFLLVIVDVRVGFCKHLCFSQTILMDLYRQEATLVCSIHSSLPPRRVRRSNARVVSRVRTKASASRLPSKNWSRCTFCVSNSPSKT